MHLNKFLTLCFIIFYYSRPSDCFKVNKKFTDVKSKCETICRESGGQVELKKASSETCKCLFNKTVNEAEIYKNARRLGVKMEVIAEPMTAEQNVSSRSVITQIEPAAYSTSTRNPKTLSRSFDKNFENISLIIKEIEDHLYELNGKVGEKEAQLSHINAIKSNLKQLTHSIGNVNRKSTEMSTRLPTKPLTSRVQQVKDRKQKYRLLFAHKLNNLEDKSPSLKAEKLLKLPEIQNPSLTALHSLDRGAQ